MYAFIRGKLFDSSPSSVTIDCNGVGYHVLIPPSVLSMLPAIGGELLLYTSFVVREQAQSLCGFITKDERDLFESLLDVNGVGPKTALSIIGHLNPQQLGDAIQNEDLKTLCKVPGIGKKTAQRLLIDMRDKVSSKAGSLKGPSWQTQMDSDPRNQTIRDAMSALINLGYNQSSAESALKKTLKETGENIDLPGLITKALKNVSGS